MACTRKQNTGHCSHFQCPYSSETTHGYECVDIITENVNGILVGLCEVGEDCLSICQHAWKKGDNSLNEKAGKQFVNNILNEQ